MRKKLSLFLAAAMLAGTLDGAVVLADETAQVAAQPSVESVNEAAEDLQEEADVPEEESQESNLPSADEQMEDGGITAQQEPAAMAEDKASDTAQPNEVTAAALSGKVTSSKGDATYAQRNVTLTAAASGGETPLEYQFTEVYNGKTTVVREYSGSNQYSFTTAGIGSHVYHVDIRDQNGQCTRCSYELNVLVHPDNVLSAQVSSSKGNATYVDRSVTLSVQASGGYGNPAYQFTEVYGGKTTVLREYSADSTYTFTTSGAGVHTYYVDIKDKEGQRIRSTYQINVLAHPGNVLSGQISSSKGSSTYVDRSVTLSAKASGGYGDLEYQFTEVYSGKTTVLQKYSADNAYEFSTTGIGTHTYYVDIRDEEGQSIRCTYKINIVAHPDCVLSAQVSSSKGGSTYVDRSVTLSANANGGYGNLEYQFTEVYGGKTTVVQKYSADNAYEFSTTGIGSHIYYVDIRDEEGQSVRCTYKINIVAHPDHLLSGQVSSSKGDATYVQRNVVLSAKGKGGYGDLQYRFTEVYGRTTWVRQDYSSDAQYSFTSTGVGVHIYYIDIKDQEGQTIRLTYRLTLTANPSYKLKGSFTSSPSGTAKPGQTVTLTASSSGGYGNTRYQFRESYNGTTKILQAYSSSRTCTTTVSGGGTHVYYVDILDSESQILTLSLNINTSLAYTYAANVLNQVGWNLRAAFNWSASLPYQNYSNDPSPGSENMALYGFQNGRGDCYVMAATFYYMAKALGYDAHQMAGYVPLLNGGMGVHSWVEIDMNGTTYVFDPDFTHETGRNGYQITYGTSGTWVYSSYYRMN